MSQRRGECAPGRDVYAYFSNDIGGHAGRDAASLRRYVEGDREHAVA